MLKNKVEIFNTQEEVVARIDQLKCDGFHDTDMYVVAKGGQIDNLQGHMENLSDEPGFAEERTLWSKLRNFVGAEQEFGSAFERLGLPSEQTEKSLEALEAGKLLLIIAHDEL
ncbi:hypothetical protein ABB02_01578 [Clostridiaceae bacterium JG1575]|nr:hypothetical protein ABB02_01578 [Clostridiaceae bacterium JG1575]